MFSRFVNPPSTVVSLNALSKAGQSLGLPSKHGISLRAIRFNWFVPNVLPTLNSATSCNIALLVGSEVPGFDGPSAGNGAFLAWLSVHLMQKNSSSGVGNFVNFAQVK